MSESIFLAIGWTVVCLLGGYIIGKFPSISERLDYIEKVDSITRESFYSNYFHLNGGDN